MCSIAMGADNHVTTVPKNAENDEPRMLNSSPLDSLEGVEGAFAHLDDDYNDGYIGRSMDGERVIIISRYRSLQHMGTLLDASHGSEGIRVDTVTAANHSGEVRTKVEVVADEGGA